MAAISFSETTQELEQVEIGLLASKLSAEEMATAMDALATKRGFATVGQDLANAAELTKTAIEGLRKEQAALAKEYFAGNISQQAWQDGHNKAAAAIRQLGGETAKTTATTKALGAELKTLADVQRAISDAKTDRDIAAANAALKKMLDTGVIGGREYNIEMKRSADRLKELKGTIEGSKKAQDDKNKSDQEAIKTSADLRRESGKRMEEERRAGDQAMQDRRNGAEEAQRDMGAMEDFFGGVLTRAREPLAAMSAAALEAFDKLSGISTVDLSLDTGSLEETTASLEKATTALGQMQSAANTVGMSSLGIWMTTTAVRSQELQVQFLKQKASLQG
ncbi:MAG: hypothetical protein K2W93_20710, partial [Burkholderiaceae bacterium]|nr:hypothetical protein [Burkholderiaceae bacterium]